MRPRVRRERVAAGKGVVVVRPVARWWARNACWSPPSTGRAAATRRWRRAAPPEAELAQGQPPGTGDDEQVDQGAKGFRPPLLADGEEDAAGVGTQIAGLMGNPLPEEGGDIGAGGSQVQRGLPGKPENRFGRGNVVHDHGVRTGGRPFCKISDG